MSHLHGSNLQVIERLQAEAHASTATITDLTRRLEIADAQLHAAAAFQPRPPHVDATAAGGGPGMGDGGGAPAQLQGVFESSTSKMSAIGYVGMPCGHSCHSRHVSMCHASA